MHNESTQSKRRLTILLQGIGFLACIGLMVWVAISVLKPENRDKLARIRSMEPSDLALLLGLSALIVFVSGGTFRQMLTPVRRLKMVDVQATSVIASLLALLPFKLSIVFRVLVHSRRDNIPLFTIGAWFLAVTAVIGAVLAPVMVVNALHPRVDGAWFVLGAGAVALSVGFMFTVARLALAPRGWAIIESIWTKLAPGFLRRSGLLDRGRESLRMIGDPWALGTSVILRLTDIAAQAARVYIASRVIGAPMLPGESLLAGSVYFLIGAIAPTGQVGAREQGTATFVSVVAPTLNVDTLKIIVVVISASELLVLLIGSLFGAVWLRPDRLLRSPANPPAVRGH